MSEPPTHPEPAPLRTRAEQIADELAAEQRPPRPAVPRLPDQAPPQNPPPPGR